jgi:hypothetical protein
MFNFHLLAIAQHYAWKSSLGFLARKILAVTTSFPLNVRYIICVGFVMKVFLVIE